MMNMNNLENVLNTLNINELDTVWKVLNNISEDFTKNSNDDTSERLDEILDKIQEHIAYREDEMERIKEEEEREANKFF